MQLKKKRVHTRMTVTTSVFVVLVAGLIISQAHMGLADTHNNQQCDSSGRREECSQQDVYPCQWASSSCEFQYEEMTFTCSDVPESRTSVTVSCTPTDTEKLYAVRILDSDNYRKYWYHKPGYECVNDGCGLWINGPFVWTGASNAKYAYDKNLRDDDDGDDGDSDEDDDGDDGHSDEDDDGDDGHSNDDDDGDDGHSSNDDDDGDDGDGQGKGKGKGKGPDEYRVVVSMLDRNTCLEITCDVVFSDI